MDDRTQHVIDAIDGALADDEFPDAMRWSPEPAAVENVGRPYTEDRFPSLSGFPVGLEHRRPVDRLTLDRARADDEARSIGRMMARSPWFRPVRGDEWTDVGHLVEPDGIEFRVTREGVVAWDPAVLRNPRRIEFTVDPEAMRRFSEAVSAWSQQVAERMGYALTDWQEPVLAAVMRPLAVPRSNPEDPRARALQLRRERNTGPSRDVVRQRRPRRLP